VTRLDDGKHRPLCFKRPNGGAGEIPAPTVTVWMGEEFRDRLRYVPLLFNVLKLKGGICMTKHLYQGVVSGNTSQRSLTLLISSVENELLQGTKNGRPTGQLDKEAGHIVLWIQTLLKYSFLTTHTPHGGKHPKTRKTPIEYTLANRLEEYA